MFKVDYEKIRALELELGFREADQEDMRFQESSFPPGALVYRGSAPNTRTADAILKEMYADKH